MLAGDGTAEWFSESAKKAKEERLRLFCEIQKPPMQMREVLMESIYLQMKDSEIGQLHGLTNEDVHKIRSRAKQKLIERMKEGDSMNEWNEHKLDRELEALMKEKTGIARSVMVKLKK